MKKTLYIITLLFFTAFCFSQKQEKQLAMAEDRYNKNFYIDAIKIYLELANDNYLDEKGLKKLANSYYFNADYANAHKWYEVVFNATPLQSAEYCYRYGQCLKSIGNYNESNRIMEQFSNLANQEVRARLIKNNKDYLQKINDNSNRYDIANLPINSTFSDFGATLWGNQLVFSSSRNIEKSSKKDSPSFNRFFVVQPDKDGDYKKPTLLFNKKKNKALFNESSATFTKDGKTMYFTRNAKVSKKDAKTIAVNLKIYKASFIKGNWDKITELPFNGKTFNTSHPALSPDEKTLYFASDRPGTLGLSDLFYVTIDPNGTYSTPVNLGETINTEGKESFPFISNNNELYFSSDGRPGLGGSDIFVAKKVTNTIFEEVKNVGAPVNSSDDDFAFSINTDSQKGYFSSSRENGIGKEDIYWFFEKHKIDSYLFANSVLDKFSGLPLEGITITLLDNQFNTIAETTTDANGNYQLPKMPYDKKMYIRAEKEGFLTQELVCNTKESKDDSDATNSKHKIHLEKQIAPVKNGDDLAKLLEIGNLYFDFEQFAITSKAAAQLAKIVKLMTLHPEVKIDIRTHTDARGYYKFNQELSEDRCNAVIAWLIEKGINPIRLSGKGYGKTQVINHCTDNVPCTEEEHERNRRCEFIFSK